MSLPSPIIQVLFHFRPAFTRPTWDKALVLVVGTILARGRRTVTAALKHMGDRAAMLHYRPLRAWLFDDTPLQLAHFFGDARYNPDFS